MPRINNAATVKKQYGTSTNLSTRISIHAKYSTNKQGLGNWISDHYDIREGMKILELGCGTGEMWKGKEELIGKCSELVLSDFSEGMIEKTRETLGDDPKITYKVIDIQDIPYEDNEFDIVIANMMLYHVPDLQKGLSEVKRVLKQGGAFYCATFGEYGILEYIYELLKDHITPGQANRSFTLQNGAEKLSEFFKDVKQDRYEDSLEVTEIEDLVDYVYSLASMSGLQRLPRETVRDELGKHMVNGVLKVPKDYGMFIARKA